MIERHIDYLALSAHVSEWDFIETKARHVSAVKFYRQGYLGAFGERYYFGNPNSKKALVVFSGTALQAVRESGKSESDLLAEWIDFGAVVSRLDLAVTEWVEDNLVLPSDVAVWASEGLIDSSHAKYGAKAVSEIVENGGMSIETVYVGDMTGRGKKGIFRAYDKGVELDLGRYLATRLEVEDKGEKAHNSAIRIAEGASIASVFRSRFDVKSDDFQRVMDAPGIDISRGAAALRLSEDEKMDNRWKWLIEQVAPALKGAIEDEIGRAEGKENLTKFLAASGLIGEMNRGAQLFVQWEKMNYDGEVK